MRESTFETLLIYSVWLWKWKIQCFGTARKLLEFSFSSPNVVQMTNDQSYICWNGAFTDLTCHRFARFDRILLILSTRFWRESLPWIWNESPTWFWKESSTWFRRESSTGFWSDRISPCPEANLPHVLKLLKLRDNTALSFKKPE